MTDLVAQPDPLSPEAQAILDGPGYPRRTGGGEPTPELMARVRAAERAEREPKVAAAAQRLGVISTADQAGGVPVVEVHPPAITSPGHTLFLHGGGWVGGLALDMSAVHMAAALGHPVLSVDYALAPEHRFPVALEQAVTAYGALTAERGGPWAVLGVSAGANMAIGVAHRARALGLPAPRALGLFTPCTDLTGHGDSRLANDGRDPVLRHRADVLAGEALYAGDAPLSHPLLSPVYADYPADFPPVLLTTGTRDVFLSDCTRLYWRLRRAGARAELRVWENLWHAFNTQPHLPEADEARAEMAAFLLDAMR